MVKFLPVQKNMQDVHKLEITVWLYKYNLKFFGFFLVNILNIHSKLLNVPRENKKETVKKGPSTETPPC